MINHHFAIDLQHCLNWGWTTRTSLKLSTRYLAAFGGPSLGCWGILVLVQEQRQGSYYISVLLCILIYIYIHMPRCIAIIKYTYIYTVYMFCINTCTFISIIHMFIYTRMHRGWSYLCFMAKIALNHSSSLWCPLMPFAQWGCSGLTIDYVARGTRQGFSHTRPMDRPLNRCQPTCVSPSPAAVG